MTQARCYGNTAVAYWRAVYVPVRSALCAQLPHRTRLIHPRCFEYMLFTLPSQFQYSWHHAYPSTRCTRRTAAPSEANNSKRPSEQWHRFIRPVDSCIRVRVRRKWHLRDATSSSAKLTYPCFGGGGHSTFGESSRQSPTPLPTIPFIGRYSSRVIPPWQSDNHLRLAACLLQAISMFTLSRWCSSLEAFDFIAIYDFWGFQNE